VITTQFSISNLFQNVLTKRDLLFTTIDSKRGNVSKNKKNKNLSHLPPLLNCFDLFAVQMFAVWDIHHSCYQNRKD